MTGTHARHTYAFDRPVSVTSEQITSGDDVDTAPRWLWTAGLVWTPAPDWVGALDWSHTGEIRTDAGNQNRYPGHDLVSAQLSHNVTESLALRVQIRNLLDTRYAERADFAFGNARYFPGEPRSVTVGLRLTR